MAQKRNALGRGLDALLDLDDVQTDLSSTIQEISIQKIRVNPDQPRRDFDQEALEELSASIREIGIIQPITLRKMSDDEYQIIAGERRFRASQMAGLENMPAYVRTVDDENVMEMALIENIQREDLNAMEIALAYQHLMDQYGLTQEKLSLRVGKKRTTIANYLRLLKLPAAVQVALKEKRIDMGHARALISAGDPAQQVELLDIILETGCSVRDVEQMVKDSRNLEEGDQAAKDNESEKPGTGDQPTRNAAPQEYALLEKQLSDYFQAKVKLSLTSGGKGKISIPFKNQDDLARLMLILDSSKA